MLMRNCEELASERMLEDRQHPCPSSYPDCSPFLNWEYNPLETAIEKAVVFQSLVVTMKLQSAVDDSLEAKAVKFLESVNPQTQSSADAFLNKFASNSDESSANFVQSIVVLISTPSQVIATAAMKILRTLFNHGSAKSRLALVSADLIHQLVATLNPLSLSFANAFGIHTCLMNVVSLEDLRIEDKNEQQSVHETVLKQVLVPLEKYLCHLCVNRFDDRYPAGNASMDGDDWLIWEGKKEKEEKAHDSPPAHLSACLLSGRRSSVSPFIVLTDDT
ncbi:hypothetical protein BLNAU_12007 [Blattamonas nauphoetae]|uniref:Uncharacterized protein n=1 Tax=Blattamonas nauphoetae TaxID=2049346 RepID=A0ABQ9XKQ7_9EUKA|nr:hypothetical protein BLNAU_12007 [Blattamonas nauphoetae]